MEGSARLPHELMIEVISYLSYDEPKRDQDQRRIALARMCRVSRAMHRLASRPLYKHLYIGAEKDETGYCHTRRESIGLIETLEANPALSQLVQELHFTITIYANPHFRVEAWVAKILRPCVRIRKLSIDTDLHGVWTRWQPALIFHPCHDLVLEHLESLQFTDVADFLEEDDPIPPFDDNSRALMSNFNSLPQLRSLGIDRLDVDHMVTTPNIDLPLTSLSLGDAIRPEELAWFLKPCTSSLRHLKIMQHTSFSNNPANYDLSVLENLEDFTALCDNELSGTESFETLVEREILAFLSAAVEACQSMTTLRRLTIGYLEWKPGRSINDLAPVLEVAPQSVRYLELVHVAPCQVYEPEDELWQWAAGRDQLETIVILGTSDRQKWARNESPEHRLEWNCRA